VLLLLLIDEKSTSVESLDFRPDEDGDSGQKFKVWLHLPDHPAEIPEREHLPLLSGQQSHAIDNLQAKLRLGTACPTTGNFLLEILNRRHL